MTPRELSALVAEKVMGWPEWEGDGEYTGSYPMWCAQGVGNRLYVYHSDGAMPRIFDPAESIADAWTVVEHLQAKGCHWTIMVNAGGTQVDVTIETPSGDYFGWVAPTASEAICRAALRAVGYYSS